MCILIKKLNDDNFRGAEVSDFIKSCSYHCRRHQKYPREDLISDFKCLELFHAAYPKYLAILYNGRFKPQELIVKCPSAINSIRLHITIKPRDIINRALNFLKIILRPIKPVDIIDKILEFRVYHSEGNCPAGLKTGDAFSFPLSNTMCPALFYSMLPVFSSYEKDISFSCPSHTVKIECKLIK